MSQASMSTEATSDDKLWAALSWIPAIGFWVALAMLLMEDKRSRPFIKYHAVHSMAVLVVIVATTFVLIGICLGAISFFAAFYWAYVASQGQTVEFPLLTRFLKNQEWV